jgi:hypothetical protein
MFLRPPSATDEYTLFLSSSDQADARMLRKRVKGLVDDVISPELRQNNASARLAVEMWERASAERPRPGETTNERFVRMAREASLTMVLILDELRDGTREELEAALDEPDAQLAVLSFSPGRDVDQAKLDELDALFDSLKDKVHYQRHKGPDSADAWTGIFRVLTAFMVSAVQLSERRQAEAMPELRPT